MLVLTTKTLLYIVLSHFTYSLFNPGKVCLLIYFPSIPWIDEIGDSFDFLRNMIPIGMQ